MSLSIYVTYWDTDPYQQIQDMIQKGAIQNTRIILAFASFNFISCHYIPGFQYITMTRVREIITLVHSVGAKISLSIGGAMHPFLNSDLYAHPEELATTINSVVTSFNFDGVDFDIEDFTTSVEFQQNVKTLITMIRFLNPSLYITLTTPTHNIYHELVKQSLPTINAWQPMMYGSGCLNTEYVQHVLNYFMASMCVPPNKIMIGLMCGQDDADNVLTLGEALDITTYAQNELVKGIVLWDANIDGSGSTGNEPYAYCKGIQTMLV